MGLGSKQVYSEGLKTWFGFGGASTLDSQPSSITGTRKPKRLGQAKLLFLPSETPKIDFRSPSTPGICKFPTTPALMGLSLYLDNPRRHAPGSIYDER